jgi:copper chaperone
MQKTSFVVPDMSCAHCQAAIEEALAGVRGVSTVAVDLSGKVVAVQHRPGVEAAALVEAIASAGYAASPNERLR